MAAFEGPKLSKAQGLGLSNPSDDKLYAFIACGVATAGYVLGDIVKLIQPEDAEAIGIDAAYDANNDILVYHHIKRFFDQTEDGTLFIKLVAQGTSLEDICDTNNSHLKGLLLDTAITERKIKRVGVVLNPVMNSEITAVNIDTPGTGYQVGEAIVATGGNGAGFVGEIASVGGSGEITGITITNPGSGYQSPPVLSITTSGGANGALSATLGNLYAPTFTDGIDDDVLAAMPKAQAIVDELATQEIRIDNVLLEGRMEDGATLNTLHDFSTEAAPAVMIISAADPAIQATNTAYANYGDVGTALGALNVRGVYENLGSVDIENKPAGSRATESYPLTNAATGAWLSANLSSGQVVADMTPAEQKALEGKHIVFAGNYEGWDGVYFNDSLTCIEPANDFHNAENNAVWNKAARLVRLALLPRLKSTVTIDTTTGYLPAAVTKSLEQLGNRKLKEMEAAGETSGGFITIDPEQNLAGGLPLKFKMKIITRAVLRAIEGESQLFNPFNN